VGSETTLRRFLIFGGLAAYACVFVGFRLFERPGLGVAHLYYVAIVLLAMAGGPFAGALAGLGATGLYAVDVFWSPHVPVASLVTIAMIIRLVSFVIVGVLIGYYAARSRNLLSRADALADELRVLARRDFATGLPNQRAFQASIAARIESGQRFGLVLCPVPSRPDGVAAIDWLLSIGERLTYNLGIGADVARISAHQFAITDAVDDGASGRTLNDRVERAVEGLVDLVAGWATYPDDAEDALGLVTAAGDRLYARAIAHGVDYEAIAALPLAAV
jgi:predicted signal transduction protein with EAL and GGDEF domain